MHEWLRFAGWLLYGGATLMLLHSAGAIVQAFAGTPGYSLPARAPHFLALGAGLAVIPIRHLHPLHVLWIVPAAWVAGLVLVAILRPLYYRQ